MTVSGPVGFGRAFSDPVDTLVIGHIEEPSGNQPALSS